MLVADTPPAGLAANGTPDLGAVPNNHLAYAGQWFFFAAVAPSSTVRCAAALTGGWPPSAGVAGWPRAAVATYGARLPRHPPANRRPCAMSAPAAPRPSSTFARSTLAGLASDGGLYVPESWPRCRRDEIAALAGLSYVETAVAGDAAVRRRRAERGRAAALCDAGLWPLRHAAVTPLVQLDHDQWLLELFHGPTLAFKDVALQLLGLLFERFLTGTDQQLTDRRRDQRRYRLGGDRRGGGARACRDLHAPPRGPRLRRPAPADDDGARAQRPQHRDRGQLRRRAGAGEGDVQRSADLRRASSCRRSIRSTGRG